MRVRKSSGTGLSSTGKALPLRRFMSLAEFAKDYSISSIMRKTFSYLPEIATVLLHFMKIVFILFSGDSPKSSEIWTI